MSLTFLENPDAKNPKNLVIFLHGYGSNGANLINLSHEFKRSINSPHFISPNAPLDWEGGFPDCYQWFSLKSFSSSNSLESMSAGIKIASQTLSTFIDLQLKRFDLEYKNLFLVGFSQGAMMAVYQGLITKERLGGIISYSGKVIIPEFLEEKTASKPEICLIHGESDDVLPFQNFLEGKIILSERNIPHQAHPIANLGHTIDMCGIKIGQKFLQNINSLQN
jgi:phospholipase/carboxylesterase